MSKSLTRDERKKSKFTQRIDARKQKEKEQYPNSETAPKPKPKVPYRSHNDWDEE